MPPHSDIEAGVRLLRPPSQLCALALLACSAPLMAAEKQPATDGGDPELTGPQIPADDTPPEAVPLAGDKPGRVSVSFGASVVGQYISRGAAFADVRSYQPYVTLTVALPELTGGAISDASVFVGNWNSIQSGSPGLGQPNGGSTPGWYETDLYVGGAVKIAERVGVSATYFRYFSPANSFDEYSDFDLTVTFDDSGLWGREEQARGFAIQPALRMVQEDGQPNRPDALYIQPSIVPSVRVGPEEGGVILSVPIAIGLSDSLYSGVDGGTPTFGFFRVGAGVAANPFKGAASAVRLTAGLDYWMLNDRVANGLDDTELVWRVGFSTGF